MSVYPEKSGAPRRWDAGGYNRIKYCHCGKYQPRSRRGVIDNHCANCGGLPKPTVFGNESGAEKQDLAEKFRREFGDLRGAGEDLSIDSQAIRESQAAKTSERLEVVRKLRADSLARSMDQRIGARDG